MCTALAARVHAEWNERPIKDADVLFCERARVEEQIEELKSRGLVGSPVSGVVRWTYHVTAGASVSFVNRVMSAKASRHVLVLDPSKVNDTLRLYALLDVMIGKRLLSLFVGSPLEWNALNELARNMLPGTDGGDQIIRPDDETVVEIASRHFNHVLEDGHRHLTLLRGLWTVIERDGRYLAQQKVELRGPIVVGGARVSAMVMEFNLPDKLEVSIDAPSGTLDCWVLGKIVGSGIVNSAERLSLSVHIRIVALLLRKGSRIESS